MNPPGEIAVSIIMPAYNSEQFIGEAIGSVVQQTFTCWELLIIDDGSTDRTSEIAKSFAAQDDRIKYIKLENNCGASTARNTAMDIAGGKYLAFLDSDDTWFPKKLAVQVSFMEKTTCISQAQVTQKSTSAGQISGGRLPREKSLITKAY